MIEKAISNEEGEGEIIIISENIIRYLINNSDLIKMIINETNFCKNHLQLLNSIPLN